MDTLFMLICGHAVADFPLQTEFIARGKHPKTNPYAAWCPWYYILMAHALTHGLAVTLVTGSIELGACETIAHFWIDVSKCMGWINIHADQALHVACKIIWAARG